jgi:hypothetical protein
MGPGPLRTCVLSNTVEQMAGCPCMAPKDTVSPAAGHIGVVSKTTKDFHLVLRGHKRISGAGRDWYPGIPVPGRSRECQKSRIIANLGLWGQAPAELRTEHMSSRCLMGLQQNPPCKPKQGTKTNISSKNVPWSQCQLLGRGCVQSSPCRADG